MVYGVIDSVNNDTKIVVLDCDGVYLKFNLSAIGQLNQLLRQQKQLLKKRLTKQKKKQNSNLKSVVNFLAIEKLAMLFL